MNITYIKIPPKRVSLNTEKWKKNANERNIPFVWANLQVS